MSFASLFATVLLTVIPAAARDDVPTVSEAARLASAGRTQDAISALRSIVAARPDDAEAWAQLALSLHTSGDYAAAHDAGERAVASPDYRATCLYNMACASALLGHVERAGEELDAALAAGFRDHDLLAVDADLDALREAGLVPEPAPELAYETWRHRRVEIPFVTLAPEDERDDVERPVVVVFPPGGMGPRSTDAHVAAVWADARARDDVVVVCVASPEDGWINHPSHHALESLLGELRKRHRVEGGTFHFVGVREGGRAAATYADMSGRHVQSLTLVDSVAIAHWADRDVASVGRGAMPVRVVLSEEGPLFTGEAERITRLAGDRATLTRTDAVTPEVLLAAAR